MLEIIIILLYKRAQIMLIILIIIVVTSVLVNYIWFFLEFNIFIKLFQLLLI